MQTYIIFLKGINVGGHNPVNMANLKKVLAEREFENVRTYINSGNILLDSPKGRDWVYEQTDQVLIQNFGIKVALFVKTAEELTGIIEKNPFDQLKETDFKKRAIVMLSQKIEPSRMKVFKDEGKVDENYYLIDDLLFVYYHNGFGKTKFTTDYMERKLHIQTTGRNWNTMLKLADMACVRTGKGKP